MSERKRKIVKDCIEFYDAREWDWSLVVEFLVHYYKRSL